MATTRSPRFVQAETVMPTVSYRSPVNPAPSAPPPAPPRARAASPAPYAQQPAPRGPAPAPRARQATPPHAAPAVRVVPMLPLEAEPSVVEMMPMARQPQRTPHVVPMLPLETENSVIEKMPVAPRGGQAPQQAFVPLAPRACDLTVVFSCRGGSGATTLAVNTAAMVARAGRSVCVVDLDLQLGDVCTALDLASPTSLSAVAREAHSLDAVSLRRRLAQHGSGICALSQAGHVDDLDPQLAARMPQLLTTLRANFDHVVVDGVRDFGDLSLAALEVATRILLVVTQDVPSVRRAARVLTLLQHLGIDDSKVALVLNRTVRRAAIDDAAIERALAKTIAARVREDGRVGESLDAGALLVDVARSRPVVDDIAVVTALCRPADPTASTRRAPRSLFSFLRGGK